MSTRYSPALIDTAAAMAGHTDGSDHSSIEYQHTGTAYRLPIRARLFLCFLLVVSFMTLITDKRPQEASRTETMQKAASAVQDTGHGGPVRVPAAGPARLQQ